MLKELFQKYECDKGFRHHYDQVYEKDFGPIREKPLSILEVGIFKGLSHQVWLEYFPNSLLFGIDIFVRLKPEEIPVLQENRMNWIKHDSMSPDLGEHIKEAWGSNIKFDIIIDDGMHTPKSNQLTFRNLIPFLKDTGTYYVEDTWPLHLMDKAERRKHRWLSTRPYEYTPEKMNGFLNEIQQYNVEEIDLRKISHIPDSYIFKITK